MTAPYGYLVKPVSERELLATLEWRCTNHNPRPPDKAKGGTWLTLAVGRRPGHGDCDTRTNTRPVQRTLGEIWAVR
ncbi:MAG: hypothetical protein IPL59_23690 [Candidatus Competibacteraceae bacterium]|nr:hypothetical protein [Candidatus Competibacteraceae bacterium]